MRRPVHQQNSIKNWQAFTSNEHLQASAFIQQQEISTNIQDHLQTSLYVYQLNAKRWQAFTSICKHLFMYINKIQ